MEDQHNKELDNTILQSNSSHSSPVSATTKDNSDAEQTIMADNLQRPGSNQESDTEPLDARPAHEKDFSKGAVAAGLVGSGVSGIAVGTIHADEINSGLTHLKDQLHPQTENAVVETSTMEEAQPAPAPIESYETPKTPEPTFSAPTAEPMPPQEITETPGVLDGDIVEAVLIDTDGDGGVDYFNILEVHADGSFLHTEGSDGTGLEGWDGTENVQGLTYHVLLQDMDSDGSYDDGMVEVIDPEGNQVVIDPETGDAWGLEVQAAFASPEDYAEASTETATYTDIDWQSFSDNPEEVGSPYTDPYSETATQPEIEQGLDEMDLIHPSEFENRDSWDINDAIERDYPDYENYQSELYDTNFEDWDTPLSFEC